MSPPGVDKPTDDDSVAPESGPRQPSEGFHVRLPRTVADAKKQSKVRVGFEHRGLSDSLEFRLWCLLVPDPLQCDPRTTADKSASTFLLQQRQVLGASLADDVLLVTHVTKDGHVDAAFAADIARALGYESEQLPVLVFVGEPEIRIFREYKNATMLQLQSQRLNGVALSLGGLSADAASRVVKKIPSVLTGWPVPEAKLRQVIGSSRRASRGKAAFDATKKYAGPAVTFISGAVSIAKIFIGG